VDQIFDTLLAGRALSEPQAESAFTALLSGDLDEARTAALLALIQTRPPDAAELAGAARAMRAHIERIPYKTPPGTTLLDTCGTGGAPKTFNVSTAAALIAAAAGRAQGLRVAKHGNRSRTGRGSAEVLAALGVNLDASPETQARCLEEAGVCFCFAMRHHPAMRHAAGPRKSLGFPTIFNLLGPLTNPAGASRQLIGVYDERAVRPVAEALRSLGAERAMVARGHDGLDELTTTARTRVCELIDGEITEREIDAAELGLPRAALDDLRATDLEDAAAVVRAVLAGEPGPRLDLALLNAAAALAVGGIARDLCHALALAREAVESGQAWRTLTRLAKTSHA